ncbi:DUF4382 domain-containing protein [Scleromatobacter humisilvae]|uniref:DUF4382 domain-containing protein n=1 Tax=Scleromatobacter humisilvae TaxID=2897159 RepID=A0A9X2C2V6_9BURK|nr:DUF4382 domain-containing protein [Scleromatobacter humisilvae]MCK9687244.1 DUF4382 domain-containing protein [Scleromatobacter humisilvae]
MASARSLASLAALFALVACGGGGSGSGATPPPPGTPSNAVLSVSLSGGASPGIDHLWVTVTGIAMHADATRVYGDGDPGWVVQTLATPVTVDLADPSLADGGAVSLLKQSVSTLGTYAQLRLLVAPSDPALALASSASAKNLQFNDEVQYTDATGAHVVPLEIVDPQSGLRLLTPFNLSADTTTPLGIEWNANSLVRRASVAGADRFTLRNELQLYNQQLLTALGDGNLQIDGSLFDSISGQLDTTNFCTGASHAGCIHDVVASATSISSDSRFHAEVRSVNVGANGSFLLYPLPNPATQFDVVIHGGNMETIVVHNVFVDPTGILKPVPTSLSSAATPIVPTLNTGERPVSLANALVPSASRVFFGQTVAGTGGGSGGADIPYAIVAGNTDPATGTLLHALALPAGPLHYASFDTTKDGNGKPPTFTTVTPAEGAGAWTVWSQGTLATGTSALTTLASGAPAATVSNPVALAGFAAGTLTVTVSGAATNGADHAELIVFNDGGIVAVADVSSQLASHGGTTVFNVPSGATASAPGAAAYGVALRTWVAASETTSARWVRVGSPLDLSTATSATAALALP